MRPELAHLADMLAYGQDAVELLGEQTLSEFRADKRTQYAVIRCLEVVGEAAARVSVETRARLPELEWRSVVGLRNVLIHRYEEIDLEALWGITRRRLPLLIPALEAALRGLDPEAGSSPREGS